MDRDKSHILGCRIFDHDLHPIPVVGELDRNVWFPDTRNLATGSRFFIDSPIFEEKSDIQHATNFAVIFKVNSYSSTVLWPHRYLVTAVFSRSHLYTISSTGGTQ